MSGGIILILTTSDRRPIAKDFEHYFPGPVYERIPSVAAVIEDVVEGF
jgi:hypothetical protein